MTNRQAATFGIVIYDFGCERDKAGLRVMAENDYKPSLAGFKPSQWWLLYPFRPRLRSEIRTLPRAE